MVLQWKWPGMPDDSKCDCSYYITSSYLLFNYCVLISIVHLYACVCTIIRVGLVR